MGYITRARNETRAPLIAAGITVQSYTSGECGAYLAERVLPEIEAE